MPPIRYAAVWTTLQKVVEMAKKFEASVHMPRIRCGLAGGEWSKIEPIILETLCKEKIQVAVHDLGSTGLAPDDRRRRKKPDAFDLVAAGMARSRN